jgi:ribosomal protein S6--L-glutamate ligase
VLDPVQVEMHLDGTRGQLLYRRRKLVLPDVVLPRIAHSITPYGLAVVNQFGMLGVPVMNTAAAIAHARNKMRCLQLLSAHGIAVPATVMARSAGDLKAMVRLVGGVPVLVKLLGGADQRGVMVCQTLNSLRAALEAILGLGHNLLIQEYVRKAGRDVRVLVVGGKALAAVRRRARMNRLANTLNRGARFEVVLMHAETAGRNLNDRIFSVFVEILVKAALAGVVQRAKLLRRARETLMRVLAD